MNATIETFTECFNEFYKKSEIKKWNKWNENEIKYNLIKLF